MFICLFVCLLFFIYSFWLSPVLNVLILKLALGIWSLNNHHHHRQVLIINSYCNQSHTHAAYKFSSAIMDRDALVPVGAFVIMSFLLFGLIVMGCMMYWNWSHRKQSSADIGDNISNGNACIYEKNNPRTYNRSSNVSKYKNYILFAIFIYLLITHIILTNHDIRKNNRFLSAHVYVYLLFQKRNSFKIEQNFFFFSLFSFLCLFSTQLH